MLGRTASRYVLFQIDAEALRHSVERPSIDPQYFRCARTVAAYLFDHVEQITSFDLIERRQVRK